MRQRSAGERPSGGPWVARSAAAGSLRTHLRVALAAVAAAVLASSGHRVRSDVDRTTALAEELELRGLGVDREGVVWLEAPPLGLFRSVVGRVPVVVRATPAEGEPHELFITYARLSPEGVLLGVGTAYNLTETSAVDEGRPVALGGRFAYLEHSLLSDAGPNRLRMFDLERGMTFGDEAWSRLERMQAALTSLQHTGQLRGLARYTYTVEPPPHEIAVSFDEHALVVTADGRRAHVALDSPLAVPEWLDVEEYVEPKPGNLETWTADRLRDVPWIGEDGVQYLKQLRLEVLALLGMGAGLVSAESDEEAIAEDLGETALEPVIRSVPVDPDIGFPPAPLEPWVTPPLKGEGAWNPKVDDPSIHMLPGLGPAFATTFIRPDKLRKQSVVYVALWDPRQVELHTMPGVAEPKSATGETGSGVIPREPAVMRRLAAACNAGFQAEHGEFGMMSEGVVYLPPKPFAATVGVLRDGSTVFGTWPREGEIPDDMMSYRQNMTVLVEEGAFNPYGRTWWGGTPPDQQDKTHTVRTGMCITAQHFVGYFYGADLSPEALAQAMVQTGCTWGMALDMNAGHSGLEFYKAAPAAELEPLGKALRPKLEAEGDVPDMDGWRFRARRLIVGMGLMYFPRYIKREGRDFFYLLLRDLLPGPPPPGAGEAGAWRVKGLPQHGFPYALAVAEVSLTAGPQVRLLEVDPRMVTTDPARGVVGEGGGAPSVVLAIDPGAGKPGTSSLWVSPSAFAVASSAPLAHATRLASGRPPASAPAQAAAAVGVKSEAGMLVYAEATSGTVDTKSLVDLLASMGVMEPIVLEAPLDLALGGDTDLAGAGKRLRNEETAVRLLRSAGAGGRRVFPDTPVVPFREWYPLQSQRIRYFKKPKKDP